MKVERGIEECQETFEKLVGKKVIDIKFKSHNHDCWRIHILTDGGDFIMTFCKGWICPVVEHRKV